MSLITRMQKQTAVYWPLASADSGGDDHDDYGQPVVTDPFEISCRWEYRVEEFIIADGTRHLSRAVVYVDRDVDVGGILMLGDLDDITDDDTPKENDGAWEIMRFDKSPNIRVSEYLRTVYL